MPKLIAFLPCEKIIVDENHTSSVIVIFQTITAQVPANAEMPQNAVAPKEWAIFTTWEPLPEDVGSTVRQIVQVLWPDDTEFQRTPPTPIHFKNDRPQQVRLNIFGFPIGKTGKITFNVWLEDSGGQRIGATHSCSAWVDHKVEAAAAVQQ